MIVTSRSCITQSLTSHSESRATAAVQQRYYRTQSQCVNVHPLKMVGSISSLGFIHGFVVWDLSVDKRTVRNNVG